MEGWFKLHRKLLDNPIVCKDADHLAIWVYLIANATHREHAALFQGKKIMLMPGQLITGRKAISDHLSISESKVQRVLKCFENEHQIEQQTGTKNRIVTLVSWTKYQISEQQNEHLLNDNRTTSEHKQEVKNVITKEKILNTSRHKRVYDMNSNEIRIAKKMLDHVKANNPHLKEPDINKWADDARKILELDKRDYEITLNMIDWIANDSFWRTNVESVSKLRKQWDNLYPKMNQRKGGMPNGPKQQVAKTDILTFEQDRELARQRAEAFARGDVEIF